MDINNLIIQVGILFFGCSAIWVLGRPEWWRKYGYVLGLVSQPFWFYMSIHERKWGVFMLSALYAYGWLQGFWFHILRPKLVQPEDPTLVPN